MFLYMHYICRNCYCACVFIKYVDTDVHIQYVFYYLLALNVHEATKVIVLNVISA